MTTLSERILGLKKPMLEVIYGAHSMENDFRRSFNQGLEAAAAIIGDGEETALDLLALMYSAYEDGTQCFEYSDDGEQGPYIGKSFLLEDDDEAKIIDLLNEKRPRQPLPPAPKAVE